MPEVDEVEPREVVETPILVRVASEPVVKEAAADKATLTTIQLKADGSTGRQRLLALQPARHKAQIIVNGSAGDYITVGRNNQQANGGGRLYVGGGPVPIESKSDLYITGYVAAANDIFVTVVEELYTR